MVNQKALKNLVTYVFQRLTDNLDENYTYHSQTHVCMVYRDSSFLGRKMNISEYEMQLLQAAACLHDIGFLSSPVEHEATGCIEARSILPNYGFSEEDIETICGMIMSTKIPQSPKTLLEKILCDADLFYLGSEYYFEIANQFKNELTTLNVLKSEEQWKNIQIGFLQTHQYHLDYSKQLLNETKAKNLSILQSSTNH